VGGQPWANRIRIVDTRNFLGVVRTGFRPGRRPDAAVFFSTVSYSRSSAMLVAWSRARERIGFDPARWGERDGAGLTRSVPYPEGVLHQSEVSMTLARALGADTMPPPPYFVPDPELAARAPAGVVYLHPGAGKPKNRWPSERFATVASGLLARGRDVQLIEGPQDAGTSAAVCAALGRSLPVVRGETIPQLAARFARAALYVGNDTGPLHLAGAVGAPTVGIYGWTDPIEWAPVGKCVRSVRANDATLESIQPASVLDAALPLLEGARAEERCASA